MTSDDISSRGYKTKRQTAYVTSTGGEVDLATVSNAQDSVVTNIQIDTTSRPQDVFRLETRDTGSANPSSVAHFVGSADEQGTIDQPVADAGAGKEYAVRSVTSTNSGVGYTVNIEVQERDQD